MCYYLKYQKRRCSNKLKSWFRLLLSSETQALGSHWGGLAVLGIVEDSIYCIVTLHQKKNQPTDGIVQLCRPAPSGLVQGDGDSHHYRGVFFHLGKEITRHLNKERQCIL